MFILVIYVSPNGTTKKTAEILKSVFEKNGHTVELIDIGSKGFRDNPQIVFSKLTQADIVGFGSPAYHMDMLIPIKNFLKDILLSNDNYRFKAFLFINYAGITSGKALLNAARVFMKIGVPVIGAIKITAPHFHHKDKFPKDVDKKLIHEFYQMIQQRNFVPIEPEHLISVLQPQKIRVRLLYPFIHVLGRKRELKISVIKEYCRNCGKCVRECPVGAINLSTFATINFSNCIHCYHCTRACAFKAIVAPVEDIDKMIEINKKIIGVETPANEIII